MKPRLFLLFSLLSALAYFVVLGGPAPRAQSSSPHPLACCNGQVGPREVDFPYYNLTNGWISTLNLVSDSPQSLDFTLAIRGKLGQVLTAPQTIASQAKLAIDLGSLITQLGGDPTGDFAEGSVAVYFTGTIMPLVGQITLRNPALSLVHESVMVENDPGRSDIPAVLNGVWWGLGQRAARVMVSNTSGLAQSAQVYLDFQGQRHPLPTPLTLLPHETKTLEIADLLAGLSVDPAQAPEGGITIVQTGPQPALIASGRITDAATGFSSSMDFPSPGTEKTSALHATGLPIGTPTADSPFAGAGTFVPHVVVRNLVGSPQTVTITVEYPQPVAPGSLSSPAALTGKPARKVLPATPVPGDPDRHPEWGPGAGTTVGTLTLGPLPVGAYSSVDYPLSAALAQLPLPLPFASIRIQYSGAAGSVQAQVSSVEAGSNLVVDSHVQNEGNGWAGSGANPWHLDDNTESILFLTNESDSPAPIGFSVMANGVRYTLPKPRLNPHETGVIDLRKLRDAQIPDYFKKLIPANATDGSVSWIRVSNVPVMGRLMVISRQAGMASNYDCSPCGCPPDFEYWTVQVDPQNPSLAVGDSQQMAAYAYYSGCNGIYFLQQLSGWPSAWTSGNTSVAVMDGSVAGQVDAVGAGSTTVSTSPYDCALYQLDQDGIDCDGCVDWEYGYGSSTVNVLTPTITVTRQNLTSTSASGSPSSAAGNPAFTYAAAAYGGGGGNIASYTTQNPNANPNTASINAPYNNGSPAQGAYAILTSTYNTSENSPYVQFFVPTFGLSCYNTQLETDYISGGSCTQIQIYGTLYSGTDTNPSGLPAGTYCDAFLAMVWLNGNGQTRNGTDIAWVSGNKPNWTFQVINQFVGADGTPVVANQTLARDRNIIPRNTPSITVQLPSGNYAANDIGGGISLYRLDIYMGIGNSVCSGFSNPIVVGACSPSTPTSLCPTSAIQ